MRFIKKNTLYDILLPAFAFLISAMFRLAVKAEPDFNTTIGKNKVLLIRKEAAKMELKQDLKASAAESRKLKVQTFMRESREIHFTPS